MMKTYDLMRIEKLKYEKKVKSDFYSSHGSVKVMGLNVTPESMKTYYYHNEIISFKFKNKLVELGKWKKEFGGEKLFKILSEKIIKLNIN